MREQNLFFLSPVVRLFDFDAQREFRRNNEVLSSEFFHNILSYVQNPNAPFIIDVKHPDTGEILGKNIDVELYKKSLSDKVDLEVSNLLTSNNNQQFLFMLYSYLRALHNYLSDQQAIFENQFSKEKTLFDIVASAAPHHFDQDPADFFPGLSQRINQFLEKLVYAIESRINKKTIRPSYVSIGHNDVSGFMDFMIDRMKDNTAPDAKEGEVVNVLPKQYDWNQGLYKSPSRDMYIPPMKKKFSIKDKWSLLSAGKKATFVGFLLLEIAAVVALGVLLPGSESFTIPAAGYLAANVLGVMTSSALFFGTAAGLGVYTLFGKHAKPAADDPNYSCYTLVSSV